MPIKHLTVPIIGLLSFAVLFFEQSSSLAFSQYIVLAGDSIILLLIWLKYLSYFKEEKYGATAWTKHLTKTLLVLCITAIFVVSKPLLFLQLIGDQGIIAFAVVKNIAVLTLIFSMFKQYKKFTKRLTSNPAQTLTISFVMVILIGSYLLMLPISTTDGKSLPLLTSLFTATSAVCVTGLSVFDISSGLSIFGKIVLLILIQIGGLGFMVFSFFGMLVLRKKMSVHDKLTVSYMISEDDMSGLFNSLRVIIVSTFAIEAISTAFLSIGFIRYYGFSVKALWFGLFHAISAFCNAGFSLYSNSFESFTDDPILTLTLACTIILGGISFIVINEMYRRGKVHIKNLFRKHKKSPDHMSLNTFVVLKTTLFLLLASFVMIYLLEHGKSMASYPLGKQYLATFFQAVTLRTAGFSTIAFGNLQVATLFFMLFIMFLGGASGSTAGGIKVNTTAAIAASFKAFLKNKPEASIKNHIIHHKQIERAFLILGFGLSAICLGVFALSLTEDMPFIRLLFEAVSAFATVGLTADVTGNLTSLGRIIIIILMFIGRVGPLTILTATSPPEKNSTVRYAYGSLAIG